MDKNLITLIVFVSLMLAGLIAVIVWLYWPEIREAHLSNKRHKRYEKSLTVERTPAPTLGTQIRSEETDYSQSFRAW